MLVRTTEVLEAFQHFLRESKHFFSELQPGAFRGAAETVVISKLFVDIKGEEIGGLVVVWLGAERTAFHLNHADCVSVLHLMGLQELLYRCLVHPGLKRNCNAHEAVIRPLHESHSLPTVFSQQPTTAKHLVYDWCLIKECSEEAAMKMLTNFSECDMHPNYFLMIRI